MGKWQQQHCRVVNKLSLEEEEFLMQAVVLPFLLLLQMSLSLELLFLLSLHLGSLLLLLQAGLARSEALVVQSLVNPSFNQSVTKKHTSKRNVHDCWIFLCFFFQK